MIPKVLMLGWEYPPFLNGGLGVASSELARALAPFAQLSLILPKSKPKEEKQIELIGLSDLNLPKLWKETDPISAFHLKEAKVAWVEVALSGYEVLPQSVSPPTPHPGSLWIEHPQPRNVPPVRKYLKEPSLYGHDLYQRILDYTRISARKAQQMDFEVIHAHDWMTFLAGLLIREQSGKPLFVHAHSLSHDRTGPDIRDWAYQVEAHAFKEADYIVTVSEYSANILSQTYDIPLEKIQVLYHGSPSLEAQRLAPPFPEQLVSFVGRFTRQKDPLTFIDVGLKLLEKYDRLRFIMAGKGDLRPQMIEKINRARVGDRFHLAGFLGQKDLEKLLQMSTVVVMPSASEPFGLVAIEAAQTGTPVVISTHSGAREVLPHALTAAPGNVEDFAEKVGALLSYPALRTEISQGLQEDVSKLSWEASALDLVKRWREASLHP